MLQINHMWMVLKKQKHQYLYPHTFLMDHDSKKKKPNS